MKEEEEEDTGVSDRRSQRPGPEAHYGDWVEYHPEPNALSVRHATPRTDTVEGTCRVGTTVVPLPYADRQRDRQ
ncbi:hypothetical protein GCM10010329_77740 [Streptomyces spiroverticillatus]|uniref:Uncharacterized protein n=1 Tax=Streptomyces finlayi TaxID=67296 RepID=A0A919CDZ6_9ACTN|nr:hypothetical protein GCM10010329_77740 [Streptomyces spiroverticillatus]GHD13433.1 hypothetical protein GCM10010334_71610 [Streptomyces finlayi]